MKSIAVFLLGLFLFVGCRSEKEIPAPPESAEVEGTVFAYFIANNNLIHDLKANVVGLYKGLAAMEKPGELLVYWDSSAGASDWPESCILRYRTEGDGKVNGNLFTSDTDIWNAAEILKEYPSQLSTDVSVMTSVIRDMISFSTNSVHYGLIIGSHGSGWLQYTDSDRLSRAIGWDGPATNCITIPELSDALESAGKKFDFLLFDACTMACAEVFYELRNVADYSIASVILVPGPGFPYRAMLPKLMEFTPSDYQKACEDYIAYYRENRFYDYGALSLVNCNQMESLASVVKDQIAVHSAGIGTYDYSDLHFYGYGDSYTSNDLTKLLSADMLQFICRLNAGELPLDVESQFKKTVLYAGYVEGDSNNRIDPANYCGMGMYLPMQTKRYWNEYFQTLGWYEAAGWDAVTWPLPQ